MKKIRLFLLVICLFGFFQSLQAHKRQDDMYQVPVSRERETVDNGLLRLDDLLRLLQSNDQGYIDEYLEKKGWEIEDAGIGVFPGEQCVTWAIDRSKNYEGRIYARGWLASCMYTSFCSDTLHEIRYTFFDEAHLKVIKAELKRNGYKPISSAAVVEKGLENVYRKDEYEVTFSKEREDDEWGADIRYSLHISNYRKSEECIAEMERVSREMAEKEERYYETIRTADMYYSMDEYVLAKAAYQEAISLIPEGAEFYEDRLLELDIEILCREAASFNANGLYEEAKEKYMEALQVKLDYKKDFIRNEIQSIEAMLKFLENRAYVKYDYKNFEPKDYEAKRKYIEDLLKEALLERNENVPEIRVEVIGEVDTLGNSTFYYTTSGENAWIEDLLEPVCQKLKLKKVEYKGYSANARAGFVYTIAYRCEVVNLKNTYKKLNITKISDNVQRSIIQNQLKTAPLGKYRFDLKRTSINGKNYQNNKLLKMRCSGGPENALLSLIVPGLGVHKVTYGARTGLGTMLPTYALLGGGVGLKVYSNKEYKKYHAATTQSDMDKHYKNANLANKAFYGCMLAGGLIWISDIIRVAVIGTKNLKEFKAYKHSHLGCYYDPELEAVGLSYTIKF